MVGLGGLEPPASPLSGVRSNHLSYRPGVEPQNLDQPARDFSPEQLFSEESGHGWPVLIFALRERNSRRTTT